MKFDPFTWQEVKANEKTEIKGHLRVRLSAPAPLYIEAEGLEVLAGVGHTFDLELAETVTWRVDAPVGVRVFFHRPHSSSHKFEGERWTNIDRMPDESGSMAEVLRARRHFELERRAFLKEMRAAQAQALSSVRAQAPTSAPEPASEPARKPASEPAPERSGEVSE